MSLGKATYGTFQNVFLADDEVVDLKEILLNHFENYVERLSTLQHPVEVDSVIL